MRPWPPAARCLRIQSPGGSSRGWRRAEGPATLHTRLRRAIGVGVARAHFRGKRHGRRLSAPKRGNKARCACAHNGRAHTQRRPAKGYDTSWRTPKGGLSSCSGLPVHRELPRANRLPLQSKGPLRICQSSRRASGLTAVRTPVVAVCIATTLAAAVLGGRVGRQRSARSTHLDTHFLLRTRPNTHRPPVLCLRMHLHPPSSSTHSSLPWLARWRAPVRLCACPDRLSACPDQPREARIHFLA